MLTFPDGQHATGSIQAVTPGINYPISYAGAVERLSQKQVHGTPSDLELVFRVAARDTGAMLAVERIGTYESRTEQLRR